MTVGISIHAPAKGATRNRRAGNGGATAISIHAPAKGATVAIPRFVLYLKYFNPRSREGSDAAIGITYGITFINFNPRSREGSDILFLCLIVESDTISIHAPAKGATQRAFQ